MKKYYKSPKAKKHNAAKARRANMRLRHKNRRKGNRSHLGNDRPVSRKKRIKNKPFEAPHNFSVIGNPEGVFQFFELAEKRLRREKGINFDISRITKLTVDTITLLIAKIKDERFNHGKNISGNIPMQTMARNMILQCHFLDHVITNIPKNSSGNKLIHNESANKVEPDIAKDACILGLQHIPEEQHELLREPLYDILIEVMQNTNNHAGKSRGIYDWWLLVYDDIYEKKTCFAFLDLGVGIFESVPMRNYRERAAKFFGLYDNTELIPDLFAGKIKSRTDKPERGKGIPQIFDCAQDSLFSTFVMISNDAYANLKTHEYRKMSTDFEGTLFYWEINNII